MTNKGMDKTTEKETLNKLKIEPVQSGIEVSEKETLNKLKIEATQYAQGIGVPFGQISNESVTPSQSDSVNATNKSI